MLHYNVNNILATWWGARCHAVKCSQSFKRPEKVLFTCIHAYIYTGKDQLRNDSPFYSSQCDVFYGLNYFSLAPAEQARSDNADAGSLQPGEDDSSGTGTVLLGWVVGQYFHLSGIGKTTSSIFSLGRRQKH